MEHLINALQFALAMAAIASGILAMRKGLTYSAMAAVILALISFGVSDLIHLFGLFPATDWIEDSHVDHYVGILGYGAFIYLSLRTRRLKTA